MRILVVEDDASLAHALGLVLRQQGWAADCVASARAAWLALCAEAFDVMLLDLGLPDGDGSALLARLRQMPQAAAEKRMVSDTPVLVMTARDEIASRVRALDMGADDYIIKPFDTAELSARIRAVQRRAAGRAQPIITYGEVRLNPATRQVWRAGVAVELSAKEFSLLMTLLDARPRVLTRQHLETSLYNWDSAVESNAIEVHIHHLRRKLGSHIVHTLRGVGYFMRQEARGG